MELISAILFRAHQTMLRNTLLTDKFWLLFQCERFSSEFQRFLVSSTNFFLHFLLPVVGFGPPSMEFQSSTYRCIGMRLE